MKTGILLALCAPIAVGIVHFFPQQSASQLLLKTFLDTKHNEVFATAAILGGGSFGPDVYITCNAMPIVDTRSGNSRPNAGNFVAPQDGMFEWSYEGPDTNFEVEMAAESQPVIGDSMNGRGISRSDSLWFNYMPAGACSLVQLVLGDEFQDSIHAYTLFDTATGAMYPTWIGSLGLQSGPGTITLARAKWVAFPTPRFSWVFVEDSVASKPTEVVWQ
ncbi:MAG TPA: hypothetical protein VGM92_11815 [Candidatus Kapabacteria bacterium]|jgi:hypothetical protein